MEKHTVLMDWKTQHNKDIKSQKLICDKFDV